MPTGVLTSLPHSQCSVPFSDFYVPDGPEDQTLVSDKCHCKVSEACLHWLVGSWQDKGGILEWTPDLVSSPVLWGSLFSGSFLAFVLRPFLWGTKFTVQWE